MIVFSGKGLLLPVFLIISIVVVVLIAKVGQEFLGLELPESPWGIMGVGFLVSAGWTWFARDTYVKVKGIKKVLEDHPNTFFFIPLKYWAIIQVVAGIALLFVSV